MSARVRRDVRLLPGRRRDARLPAPDRAPRRARSRSSRRTARRTCSGTSPTTHPTYSQVVELDLGDVEPSLAGPRRPQDRVPLATAKEAFIEALGTFGVDYENGTYDKDSPTRSRRATRRRASGPAGRAIRRRPRGRRRTQEARACRRRGLLARPRLRRHRRDHVVHEHLEPVGDDRRRPAREEGGRARPDAQAVGEVLARARARRSSPSTTSAPGLDRYLDELGFNTRRLRLHDVHRQLRPAARRDLGRDRRGRARRLRRALGQPQLRGAHPRRGEGELPRVAAARRRVRARRPDGHRPRERAARPGRGRRRRLPARHVADARGDRRDDRGSRRRRDVRSDATPTSSPATSAGARSRSPPGELYAWDAASTYVRQPPYFDGMPREPGTRRRHRRTRACLVMLGDSVTTDHISPAGAIRPDSPAGTTCSSTASSGATSTRTARGAATTR